MNLNASLLILFLLTRLPVFAQDANHPATPKDTVIFMNGGKLTCQILDTSFHKLKVNYKQKYRKEKTIVIDDEMIFSVLYHDGHEQIIYEQDTIAGHYFTIDETRMFIYGRQDAEKNYRCPVSTISSIAVGIGSAFTGNIIALVPPFVWGGLLLVPKIKIKYAYVSNPVYLNYDTYVMGFEKVARRKKFFHSLAAGFGGLAAGAVGILLFVPKT
jgi:hypothetical protein